MSASRVAKDAGMVAGIAVGGVVVLATTVAWLALPVAVCWYLFTH